MLLVVSTMKQILKGYVVNKLATTSQAAFCVTMHMHTTCFCCAPDILSPIILVLFLMSGYILTTVLWSKLHIKTCLLKV